jgi:hypothetical protein
MHILIRQCQLGEIRKEFMQTVDKLDLSRVFILDPHDFHDQPIISFFAGGFVISTVGLLATYLAGKGDLHGAYIFFCCAAIAAMGLSGALLAVLLYLFRAVTAVVVHRRMVREKREREAATAKLRSIVSTNREALDRNAITEISISYLEEPFEERSTTFNPPGDSLPAGVQDAIQRLFHLTIEAHLDYSCSWERGSLTLEVKTGKIMWNSEDICKRSPREYELVYEPKPAVVL